MAENGDFADGFEAGRRQALELMEDVRQEIVSLAVEVMNTPSGYFPDTIGLGCPHVPGLLGDRSITWCWTAAPSSYRRRSGSSGSPAGTLTRCSRGPPGRWMR